MSPNQLNSAFDEILRIPFTTVPKRSWHVQEFEDGIAAWLATHDINTDPAVRARIQQTRPGHLTLLLDPGMDDELLWLSGHQMAFMFALDDQLEGLSESSPAALVELTCELLDLLCDTRRATPSVWGRGLDDLHARIRLRARPAQVARWKENIRSFLHADLLEAAQRTTGRPAELPEFLTVRLLNGGCLMWYPLFEMCCEQELAEADLYNPTLQDMMRSSANIAALINDLYSMQYERRHGLPINLVLAYQTTKDCTLERAVKHAAEYINREIARFLRLYDQVTPHLPATCANYLEGMLRWISGTHQWSRTAPRYSAEPVTHVGGDLCFPTH